MRYCARMVLLKGRMRSIRSSGGTRRGIVAVFLFFNRCRKLGGRLSRFSEAFFNTILPGVAKFPQNSQPRLTPVRLNILDVAN